MVYHETDEWFILIILIGKVCLKGRFTQERFKAEKIFEIDLMYLKLYNHKIMKPI
jgi:hypothetical protein